jgi:hypothetical protein
MRYDQGFESAPPQFRPGQHLVITDHHIDQQETSRADAACVLAVLNCLEQNILARAFCGELVLQDKAELPASVDGAAERPAPRRRVRALA